MQDLILKLYFYKFKSVDTEFYWKDTDKYSTRTNELNPVREIMGLDSWRGGSSFVTMKTTILVSSYLVLSTQTAGGRGRR